MRSGQGGRQALVALVGGLVVACLLVLLGMAPRRQTILENRAMPVGRAATAFVDKWTNLASADFQTPMEVLSARAAGIPVVYPSIVVDKSGKLKESVPPQMLAAIQKPAFNVVPAEQSSKLACVCGTCDPDAGFPPVCNNCNCEEFEDKPDLFMAGHVVACREGKCDDLLEEALADAGVEATEDGDDDDDKGPKNPMNKYQCTTWACYNQDGWFCSCTCPGKECEGGWF